MSGTLGGWVEQTRWRRGEHLPGEPFSPGLIAGTRLDPRAARRVVAETLVTLVGGRAASVSFAAGPSYASLDGRRVNIDGTLLDPGSEPRRDVDELLAGVASHEGGHVQDSRGPGKRPTALQHWLYNLVEDERIETQVARRWPALSPPLTAARRELLQADPADSTFLSALFQLVRSPDRMPVAVWSRHARMLQRAIRILTPFPDTPAEVAKAVRALARLVPYDERRNVPPFPSLALGDHLAGGRERSRRRFASGGKDEWSEQHPAAMWSDAPPDPAGYGAIVAGVADDARVLRAAFVAALRPTKAPAARAGLLDRRRLFAYRHDDRLFRVPRAEARELVVALILDLSGSMRASFGLLQRVGVTFSEAVLGLSHVRLYVYGHAADGEAFARTEIVRFATPARGPVLSLGSLPHGANNRDGHALALIADDLARLEPSRQRSRVALHACDGDPCASGYGGQPAQEATRAAIAAFRLSFGPLLLLGMGDNGRLDRLGATVVRYRDGRLGGDLLAALAPILAARR